MSITLPQPQDHEPCVSPRLSPTDHTEDRLRLAVVAPPWFELPPVGYGGTEAVVAALVDSLVDRGHEVTLVASGRHRTRAQHFVQVYEEPPSALLGTPMPEVQAAAIAAEALADLDVDLVHDHSLAGPLLARGRGVPTVATLHGPATGANGDYFERLGRSIDVIAISEAQRRLNPRINWVGVVHNAVDVASFPFVEKKDDFVLWLGRFSPDKGAHLAIDAARKAGRRIVLAGKLNEPEEKDYFRDRIEPRLGPDATYVGEADAELKRELFGRAACLAFPIQWEEPFGMVMVEAMACGTPVVALRRGSVPEVVADGVSGIIVDRAEDLAAGIERAGDLSPFACRRHATGHFDLPVMAAGYERIFRMLAEGSRGLRDLTVARSA
ncbi:glycosyltransferase family 4 protein [Nocardioides sp.]|jgi:glycosyltransferase involved in cell wall biosynthesis|uniref:glycosyltransferase family 4 protein n=1 Tax=Nocardioides sp. TaxID=35761 RepID=UPI002C53C5A5|nr:glycosyltransferase family 4 protein [Nocardioides sp.]HVX55606.1 glycosyltransferase family 4 protein [Nocardioides sp.]